jgi:hypothetical protein
MGQIPSKPAYGRMILGQLRHPVKLRVILSIAIVVAWQLIFFMPMSERMAATTARIEGERKRLATAREVERLRKGLAPYRELVSAGGDANEMIRRVIEHIRSSPLRLIDLKPEGPKGFGPYRTIGLRLTLDGHFADVDAFLGWVESGRRLTRIDAIQLTPNHKDPSRLNVQLTLLSLTERPAAVGKAQAQAGRP